MKIRKLTKKQLANKFKEVMEKAIDTGSYYYRNRYYHLLHHVRKQDIFGWGKNSKNMDPLKKTLKENAGRYEELKKEIKILKEQLSQIPTS